MVMDSSVGNDFAEEEEIITSSVRYLDSSSLNFQNLTHLQAIELKHVRSFYAKAYEYMSVLIGSIYRRKPVYCSNFEDLVLNLEPNDCSLVAKYSSVEYFAGSYWNCINIPHPLRIRLSKAANLDNQTRSDVLTKINSTPLVVFVHGLGGQMSQFEQMIAIMSQCADIFSLDLPGFGNTLFKEKYGNTLTQHTVRDQKAMIECIQSKEHSFWETNSLAATIAEIIEQKRHGRKVILIGHSMGTHLCMKISKALEDGTVASMVLISPPRVAAELPKKKLGIFARFPQLLSVMRIWDRIGGLQSASVGRQLFGQSIFKRLRQLRWNLDVDSEVLLRYIEGFQSCTVSELLNAVERIPNERVLIVCGKEDLVTPSQYTMEISQLIEGSVVELLTNCGHNVMLDRPETVSGLVYKFIESFHDLNINLGKSLQMKAMISGDKWSLKNEMKWKNLTDISTTVVNRSTGNVAPLLAMKTLRESDRDHNPLSFENNNPSVVAIIDISSDLASYNPDNFQRIKYHKMPTVSKFIPDSASVRRFISLVDEILSEVEDPDGKIAVHCHYGFNRTGYLICCYLIEKLGWDIDDAIAGFKMAREPGIKHPHFIDGLYLRYSL